MVDEGVQFCRVAILHIPSAPFGEVYTGFLWRKELGEVKFPGLDFDFRGVST